MVQEPLMTTPSEKITQLAVQFQTSSLIQAAGELDLFTAMIQKSASTVENLAHSLNLDRRGLAVLLDGLVFLGILDKEAERYSVKAEYTELLDSRSSKTLVPMLAHWGTCQRAWSQLAHVVRTGHPAPKVAGTFGPYADDQAFILGMNSIAGPLAAQIAADLAAVGITGFRQMLDLGGASGTYTLAFLRAGIAQAGVIFDRPVGIMAAQERLGRQENEVFRNRVSLVSGDFYRDSYPPECDFHWISAIIHQQDLDATRAMFAESYRTLDSGGTIAIRDIFVQSDPSQTVSAAMFAVNMLVNTEAGRVYTVSETERLLTEVGFTNIRFARKADDMTAVLVADKKV